MTQELSAPVFNIQSYSIHDGPGIRTTVFLKGCPLRCVWCQNPESQNGRPELMVYGNKCTLCGRCIKVCPEGAISLNKQATEIITDRDKCTDCGSCAAVCPNSAREICGRPMTTSEVLATVLRDKLFLEESGGGMTVSGGEALFYPAFTAQLLEKARAEGLHTAVESCCFASREAVEAVFAHTDLAICDIKHMDTAVHERLTGAPNGPILENIRHIYGALKVPMIIRIPVIPGCNDTAENIKNTAEFIAEELDTGVPLQLLKYNKLGESKNENLGITDAFKAEALPDEHMERLAEKARALGLKVQIGGSA